MTEWIVTSSVLILVIVALRYLLRGRISLRVQYALWAVVLLRLLLPVQLGESALSVLNAVEENQELQITVSRPMFYLGETPDLAMPEVAPDPMRSPEELAQLRQQLELQYYEEMAQYATPVTPATVLRAVWVAGIAVTAAWFLLTNLRFAAALRRSRRLTSHRCGKLAVYVSPLVETPCLFGLFRPNLYVTERALADDTVLRHVLAHEETHYRHGDHIWSVLRGACLALHWYHPLVWLAAALSRRDAELACDEGTLRRLGESERTAYGETLISLTCGRKQGELLLTATTMTGSKKSLRERITLIARKPKMAVCTLLCALLVVAIAAGCTFTGSREPAEPELAFLELPDAPVDAQVLSAVKTYIIAHADILNDLAGPGTVTGAYIHSIVPSSTDSGTENALCLYEVVYYLQCRDPLSVTQVFELAENDEFAEKWQSEGTNGHAPVLVNPIHCGFRAEVTAPYSGSGTEQTPEPVLYASFVQNPHRFSYTPAASEGVDAEQAAYHLMEQYLTDLSTPDPNRTFTLLEWRDLTLRILPSEEAYTLQVNAKGDYGFYGRNGERGENIWIVTIDTLQVRYEGSLSPFGPAHPSFLNADGWLEEKPYQGSLAVFHLERTGDTWSLFCKASPNADTYYSGTAVNHIPLRYSGTYQPPSAILAAGASWVRDRAQQLNALAAIPHFVAEGDIRSFALIDTASVSEFVHVRLYSLDYRLRVPAAADVELPGMVYSQDAEGLWLVEKDSANNPILVMAYRYNDEIWSCAGTLTESEIAAQYGGDYTRAAAEFYESARNAPQ